jgi:sigma54-dependent transcription regulator
LARQDLCCVVAAADVAAAAADVAAAAADVHLATTIVFAEHSELHLLVVVVAALMPMTTNHPIAVAVVLLLLLMLPLPARRLSAASGPPAREKKKKKTCSVAVVERDNATHSALYRSIEREREMFTCVLKSLLFVNFGFFAAASG